jgi:hypothetical protein
MAIDGPPTNRSKWRALGGKLWMGDISPDKTGKNVQDVKITGIPLENAMAAIRMARVKPKRVLSETQRLQLEQGRQKSSLAVGQRNFSGTKRGRGRVVVTSHPLSNRTFYRLEMPFLHVFGL